MSFGSGSVGASRRPPADAVAVLARRRRMVRSSASGRTSGRYSGATRAGMVWTRRSLPGNRCSTSSRTGSLSQ